jgi:uncharacterized membrane protein
VKPRVAYRVGLASYLGLLLLVPYWHAWLHPSAYFPTALVLLVTAVPLLLPLRGLLRERIRAHVWASLLMPLYFMHGLVEALVNPPQRIPALLEVVLSLAAFLSTSLYARWAAAATDARDTTR